MIGHIYGSRPAQINVTGPSGKSLCYDIELTSVQSILFYFYPGVIPSGQEFKACTTLLDSNVKSCVFGLNHNGRQHESVRLLPQILS